MDPCEDRIVHLWSHFSPGSRRLAQRHNAQYERHSERGVGGGDPEAGAGAEQRQSTRSAKTQNEGRLVPPSEEGVLPAGHEPELGLRAPGGASRLPRKWLTELRLRQKFRLTP